MSEAQVRAALVANGAARKAVQQARAAFTGMSAQLKLGEVTWDEESSTFEYAGHTIRARQPEGGEFVFIGRDGDETVYTRLSPGVFKSTAGVIVVDFTPIVRGEVEALGRELRS